ncbi:hypothetical protein ABZS66_26015 [Dactylosporangium sp. NPDC005572]|uniref:hypothetical protein n=1 Tax=Dactylosporangium sp. NPDC005572 TaxID=3156889 RepID=UPI0033A30BDB
MVFDLEPAGSPVGSATLLFAGRPARVGAVRFEDLVAEAQAVPLRGWDFTWLAGRTKGSTPTWSYPALAGELLHPGVRLLDVDTGGGELLASLAPLPAGSLAVEGWPPNVPVAERKGRLAAGAGVAAPTRTGRPRRRWGWRCEGPRRHGGRGRRRWERPG